MNKAVFVGLFSVALSLPVAANAQDLLVRFDGGIGSQPLRAGALVNDVFGVAPGGRPWVISRLIAEVVGRRIIVNGQGLVLAGGNSIGTGGGQSVRARLFCGGVPHDWRWCRSRTTAISASTARSRRRRRVLVRILSCSSSVPAAAGSRPGSRGTRKTESDPAQDC